MKALFLAVLLLSLSAAGDANDLRSDPSTFRIPRTEILPVMDPETHRQYDLFIKLPRNHKDQEDKSRRYPVIYLTDAMYTFQVVSGATRYPMTIKKMEEAIIVGVSWDKDEHSTASRVRDYTPSHDPDWKLHTGEAETHLRFFRETVFPTVEKRYRADPERRTYVGNSLGGLLGAYTLLKHTDMFANYVLGSPSLWFDDRMIFELEKEYAKQRNDLRARVFMAIGEQERPEFQGPNWNHDMVADADRFYRALHGRQYPGLQLEYRVIGNSSHETAFPTTAIQGLYWLLKI